MDLHGTKLTDLRSIVFGFTTDRDSLDHEIPLCYETLREKPILSQRNSLRNFTTSYVEIKCQLDATEVFIADLIACSTCFGHHYAHHQELKSITQWLLPVVFRAVVFKLLV